jgi:hypothetical protein
MSEQEELDALIAQFKSLRYRYRRNARGQHLFVRFYDVKVCNTIEEIRQLFRLIGVPRS